MATDDQATGSTAEQSILNELAAELERDDFSHEAWKTVSDKLTAHDGSTDARIKHLQEEVTDLAAYTDALEEFLNEQGTAQQLLTEVRDELSTLHDDIEAINDRMNTQSNDIDSLTHDIQTLEAGITDVRDTLHQMDELETRLTTLEDELTHLQDELDDLIQFRDQIATAFE